LVLLLYPLWLVTSLLSLHSEELSKKVSLDSFLADVYERLTKKGEKPGFMQLLAAQVTSAVWHVCSFPCPQIFHLLQLKKKSAYSISQTECWGSGWNRACILGTFCSLSIQPSWLLVQEVNIGLTCDWWSSLQIEPTSLCNFYNIWMELLVQF
jgi:hypothetical protein